MSISKHVFSDDTFTPSTPSSSFPPSDKSIPNRQPFNPSDYYVFVSTTQKILQFKNTQMQPERGSEVFVAKVPREMTLEGIARFFSAAGRIFNVRMMLDFDGATRSYAFVSFFAKTDAVQAVEVLNNFPLGNGGKKLLVMQSVDNRRIFVGKVPRHLSKEEIEAALRKVTPGIAEVMAYPSREPGWRNRGYVFVEYDSHREAAAARKLLRPDAVIDEWKVAVTADWADPVPDVCPILIPQIKKLFMRNLDPRLSYQEILTYLRKYISFEGVLRLYTKFDYGFIHFTSRKHAEDAFAALQGKLFGTSHVQVEWARPTSCNKQNRMKRPPSSFCTAVPPHTRRQVMRMKEARIFANSLKNDIFNPTLTLGVP